MRPENDVVIIVVARKLVSEQENNAFFRLYRSGIRINQGSSFVCSIKKDSI
jgi:hypothetical protein